MPGSDLSCRLITKIIPDSHVKPGDRHTNREHYNMSQRAYCKRLFTPICNTKHNPTRDIIDGLFRTTIKATQISPQLWILTIERVHERWHRVKIKRKE